MLKSVSLNLTTINNLRYSFHDSTIQGEIEIHCYIHGEKS